MRRIYHLIDGREVPSHSGSYFASENPATGEQFAEVAAGDETDVDAAVKAALRAFQGPWSKITPAERGRLLYRVAELIEARAEELAAAETLDSGKPLAANRHIDLPFCVDFWRFYAGAADKLRTPVVANEPGVHRYAVREPLGVVGAIAPWNFPLVMASLKIAPALAAGNTVVIKMAEQTPLTTSLLGQLCLEAGLPEGVVNVVHGFGERAGAALVRHPQVAKICFTGSTEVGRLIGQECARQVKPFLLELGGKAANIIFADADLDLAVNGALQAGLANNGQFCLAASRVLVEERVADRVTELLIDKARSIRVGEPHDPATHCGPLISRAHLERVSSYVASGCAEGAELLTGGAPPRDLPERLRRGFYFAPTVFGRVRPQMRIAREEIFGPVIGITSFRTEEEAIALANGVDYGLSAYFWTKDADRVHRVASALDAGLVFVNMPQYMVPQMPAGLRKSSGWGQNFGLEALENYTKLKGVYVNYSGKIFPWLT